MGITSKKYYWIIWGFGCIWKGLLFFYGTCYAESIHFIICVMKAKIKEKLKMTEFWKKEKRKLSRQNEWMWI